MSLRLLESGTTIPLHSDEIAARNQACEPGPGRNTFRMRELEDGALIVRSCVEFLLRFSSRFSVHAYGADLSGSEISDQEEAMVLASEARQKQDGQGDCAQSREPSGSRETAMRYPQTTRLVVVLLSLGFAGFACADTIYVNNISGNDDWDGLCEEWDGGTCGPKKTVQAGIDAASNGDEVIVSPGTYNEVINFIGRAITLRSSDGPEVTIIDGAGLNDSVVKCYAGEDRDTRLEGFAIKNGTGDPNNPVPAWLGYHEGGGMINVGSSPTVINCIFDSNRVTAPGSDGGGMANWESAPCVVDCVFINNTARGVAGGMVNAYSNAEIINCYFISNTSDTHGAGINNVFSSPIIINCCFAGNRVTVIGYWGGAIANRCNDNTSFPQILNCTFVANDSPQPGVIWTDFGSHPTITNCVFWDNLTVPFGGSGAPIVTYCNVEGGYAGEGNIDADPQFFRDPAPGDDGEWGTADDDYGDLRLMPFSQCIDAGDTTAVPADLFVDLDGLGRRIDNPDVDDTGVTVGLIPVTVDMGAYEYHRRNGDINGDGDVNAYDIDGFILLVGWG
ncbi:MAG: hypothetical protein ABIG44_01250 [Planctomycetota bacterium]